MTTPVQENNDSWVLHEYNLRSQLFFDYGKDAPVPSDIKWFQIKMDGNGDTDVEKIEAEQAKMEQVKLGILKVVQQPAPPVNAPIKIADPQKLLPLKKKIGPNDPCSCGSGVKFKRCHGKGTGRI
jgi:hypothetical protein